MIHMMQGVSFPPILKAVLDWHDVLAQAIFQCIQGLPEGGLRRIILTASGGAFRDWPVEKLKEVKAADAIKHPNWRYGALQRLLLRCDTRSGEAIKQHQNSGKERVGLGERRTAS